ncbi:MAG: sirohydrochlorin chelatase [Geitlerinemataceae cyanobacterium]
MLFSPPRDDPMGIASNCTSSSAYLLVFHGSRDPRPQQAIEILVQQVADRLGTDAIQQKRVSWAALELQPQPLHQQICQFAEGVLTQEIDRIEIIPLFLLPGVHVKEDIPAEVELARQKIGTEVEISIRPFLGSSPSMAKRLTSVLKTQSQRSAWVLLSHGSRRPGGNEPIENLTLQLHQQCHKPVVPAYWSVPPNLETQIQALVNSRYDRIGILPYFLFAGGITDAIAESVDRLSSQFPQTQLHLAEPVGVSDELVEHMILDEKRRVC